MNEAYSERRLYLVDCARLKVIYEAEEINEKDLSERVLVIAERVHAGVDVPVH